MMFDPIEEVMQAATCDLHMVAAGVHHDAIRHLQVDDLISSEF